MSAEILKDDSAPPDAGEPQGANDDRPTMLGKRFRLTLVSGMLIGLVLALIGHALLSALWWNQSNGWSWILVAIGGVAVGGAFSLFTYGTATDRTDTGPKPRGQAAVSFEGEERAEKARERRRAGRR
jgi:hypothetical protein